MVGYIYLITDTTHGMKYTGKHHYHIEGQLDPNYHGSGTIIKNIYKKRPETLKEEYIKTCYSEEEMCSDEQYYIKLFKTLWPNGYNLTEGGDGWSGGPCEEIRKKMSESHKGKQLSEETKKKLSEAHSGEKHHFFGKHHSEESKKKMSDAHKGKPAPNKGVPMNEETKKKISEAIKEKFIYDEEYRRKISEAHKNISDDVRRKYSEAKKKLYSSSKNHPMFGKHHSEETKKKMSDAHKGKPSPNKGKPMSEETKKKLSESHKGKSAPNKGKPMTEEQKKKMRNNKRSKKVLQFTLNGELIKVWESIRECGRNGFDRCLVSACCRGKLKTHKGFKWCYADDYKE